VLFAKFPSCLIAHGEPVIYPSITSELDYEGELAVVIGRRATNVPAAQALEYVGGYTIINDVSAGITLEPGDIIATGTPSGVALGMNPPVYLQPGDKVSIEIPGIGELANTVAPSR
jgi:2-keto-4-pentenoate hydratase/2-oxohepta-3-ene-1,7-dioic acid hydratase in catechol pathway